MRFRPSQARFVVDQKLLNASGLLPGHDYSYRLASVVDPSIGGFAHSPEMDFTLIEYKKGHYAQLVEGNLYDVFINRKLVSAFSPTFIADSNLLTVSGFAAPFSGYYGDGSDGNYVLDGIQPAVSGFFSKSGNSYTLLREAYFNNLTIAQGITLYPQGSRIFVKQTLTVNGTIDYSGLAGGAGTNGNGNAAGTGGVGANSNSSTGILFFAGNAGVNGGDGNNAGNGGNGNGGFNTNTNSLGTTGAAGGTGGGGGLDGMLTPGNGGNAGGGGTVSPISSANGGIKQSNWITLSTLKIFTAAATVINIYGSGGAGAGGGGGAGAAGVGGIAGGGGGGGGSGSGGGSIVIFAQTVVGTGNITATGGAGGGGGNGGNGGHFLTTDYAGGGGGGAGGAGGSGGIISIVTHSITGFVGTLSASGGSGGSGGTGGASGGGASTGGSPGGAGSVGAAGVSLVYLL